MAKPPWYTPPRGGHFPKPDKEDVCKVCGRKVTYRAYSPKTKRPGQLVHVRRSR